MGCIWVHFVTLDVGQIHACRAFPVDVLALRLQAHTMDPSHNCIWRFFAADYAVKRSGSKNHAHWGTRERVQDG